MSALRRELQGMNVSLCAAHNKIDEFMQHVLHAVQQVGHDVSLVAHKVSVATEQTSPVLLAAAHRLIGWTVAPPEPRPWQPLPISPPLPSIVDTWGTDTSF